MAQDKSSAAARSLLTCFANKCRYVVLWPGLADLVQAGLDRPSALVGPVSIQGKARQRLTASAKDLPVAFALSPGRFSLGPDMLPGVHIVNPAN